MSSNETLMETCNFNLPTMVEGEAFTVDELADDMDGLHLKFLRVKIPAGGALQFEIPGDDPENPDYKKYLEGVILFNHASCAYWLDGEMDDNTAPLCSSVDGKVGIGEPGGTCAVCALNRFGSGENGKGKACKNMRILYLLRDGEYMPLQITLPPTSIKPFNDFYSAVFAARRRGTCGSIVQIGLKRVENGTNTYSVATFRKLYDFSGEELAQVKAYAEVFKEQIKIMLQQRAEDAANRPDDVFEECEGYTMSGDDSSFVISSPGAEIDGDRDVLPA
ncbi:hypothetical protein [Anaerocolumna xylanovorans]|uniref:Uncharacterized protein n=1 Tax=Anaerocolumna xylanovorans DSM 12503 TaxID=1121345 RepID=A0A1M7YNE3_9FIRM|nr:hypothetical protein [Anaerocolumna xylanovorans]SHO54163.1 hypothetical protein SAMN02745217_04618 [Anaerocolumna xylanovorans DSM 12503]